MTKSIERRALFGGACFSIFVVAFAPSCDRGAACEPKVGDPQKSLEIQQTGFVCSDTVNRVIQCAPDLPRGFLCKCIQNGAIGKTFEMEVYGPSTSTAIAIAHDNCGWNIRAR